MSQREFSNKLGNTRDWVRHTESGRNKIIHKKVSLRWVRIIEELMRKTNISLEKSLEFFKFYKVYSDQKFTVNKQITKSFWEISEQEIVNWFERIKNETKNFTMIEPKILFESPRNILILRLILGYDHRSFGDVLGRNHRSIRGWERMEMLIKTETVQDLIPKIRDLFEDNRNSISLENTLMNFRTFRNLFGNRNLESSIKNGLILSKNQKPTELENRISKLLIENKIKDFESHGIIEGIKKGHNIDFVIPKSNPKFLIETFSHRHTTKTMTTLNLRITNIDHKFQMVKMKNPKIKTIMYIELRERPIRLDVLHKSIETDLINTDYLLLNEIPQIIKS